MLELGPKSGGSGPLLDTAVLSPHLHLHVLPPPMDPPEVPKTGRAGGRSHGKALQGAGVGALHSAWVVGQVRSLRKSPEEMAGMQDSWASNGDLEAQEARVPSAGL